MGPTWMRRYSSGSRQQLFVGFHPHGNLSAARAAVCGEVRCLACTHVSQVLHSLKGGLFVADLHVKASVHPVEQDSQVAERQETPSWHFHFLLTKFPESVHEHHHHHHHLTFLLSPLSISGNSLLSVKAQMPSQSITNVSTSSSLAKIHIKAILFYFRPSQYTPTTTKQTLTAACAHFYPHLYFALSSPPQKSTPHCSRVFFLSPCRASIVQKRIIYFQDEGPLTRRMCEKGRLLYRHGMNNLLPVSYPFHLPAASLFRSLLLLSFSCRFFFF